MKKIILLIGFAVGTLVANAQILVGVNTKLNNYTFGVDANNIGYYGSLSYSKIEQGKLAPLFRYDIVDADLHPNAKHYDAVSSYSNEVNTTIAIGKVLNNNNDFRVGVHIGINYNQKEFYNNYNDKDLGSFSILSNRVNDNSLVGGVYLNYHIGWVKIDVSTNKQITTSLGLFIPLKYERNCLR
jgi:hypothetical protein